MKNSIFVRFCLVVFVFVSLIIIVGQQTSSQTVTVSATVGSSVSCSNSTTTASFGTLTTSAVGTTTPTYVSSSMSCNAALGCSYNLHDLGNGGSPGLATSSPAYLIASADATLSAGTEGYGVQTATTTAGSGGTLGLNSKYRYASSTLQVGGLTIANTLLASSTTGIVNREILVYHRAAIAVTTPAGSYTDTLTYSCSGN